MFTGLVEGLGEIVDIVSAEDAMTVRIKPPAEMVAPTSDAAHIGDSIAINGCCLTVVKIDDGVWSFEAGAETLSRTNLGQFAPGQVVNLERSVRPSDRLGGHFVQGHVDALGTVDEIQRHGEWVDMWFRVSGAFTGQMVPKGSVAVDGISLTLVHVERERFSVALIPHTLAVTTLGTRQVGDNVNIETDILGKYMAKMFAQLSESWSPPQERSQS